MTYIELFAKLHIENLCSSLISVPDRIVLIGDSMKTLKRDSMRYEALLAGRGFHPEFILKGVSHNNMDRIVRILCELIETYDDCVFDITGGEDVYLVAAGIAVSRYPDKHIQMHKINIKNGNIIDCDMDGTTIEKTLDPSLSVNEYITLYGGQRKYADGDDIFDWNLDNTFRDDLATMWNICRKNHREWNAQISAFSHIARNENFREDGSFTPADRSGLNSAVLCHYNRIISDLQKNGLICYEEQQDKISLSFKNASVKLCLTTIGQVLETVVFTAASGLLDESGKPVFNDVQNHVLIGWDEQKPSAGNPVDTQNEIDVMLTRGMVPVFISCKNGRFTSEELFKLNSVAENFGGKYAKKVLVTTYLTELMQSKPVAAQHLLQRANELNIRIVANAEAYSMSKLESVIGTFGI